MSPQAWPHRAVYGALLSMLMSAIPLAAQLPAPAISNPHPLHLAGYGSLVFSQSTESADDIPAGDAAVIASGTLIRRLSYFLDLQAASWTEENWTGQHEEHHLNVARLYAEYAVSDAFRLRLGRFLTPIGQWNEIFADPLTWTVLRPLTTYRPFAKSVTGILAAGTMPLAHRDVGYAVYASPPTWSQEEEQETGFIHAVGGRVAVELRPGLAIGASTARFRASRPLDADDPGAVALPANPPSEGDREEEGEARVLLGVDMSWDVGRTELLAEAVGVTGTTLLPAERGAFIQGAVRTLGPVYLVARSEIYDGISNQRVAVQTLGGSLRLFGHATIKLDWQFSSHPSVRVRDGWFVSLSALF